MIVSDFILDEWEKFARSTMPKTSRTFVKLVRDQFEMYVRNYDEIPGVIVIRDPNDIDIVRLAIAHRAMIISSDKDLLTFQDLRVSVLSPADYRELFMKMS